MRSKVGRNSRENYDRNIYNQLEETINKVEKMAREITAMKTSHRSEIYLLSEKHELATAEQKCRLLVIGFCMFSAVNNVGQTTHIYTPLIGLKPVKSEMHR